MKTNAAVAGLIALGCLCLSFSPRITDSPAAGKTASSSVSAKTDSLQREVRRFEDTVRQMEKELDKIFPRVTIFRCRGLKTTRDFLDPVIKDVREP